VAAGLSGCPQFTRGESLHAMSILDSIHAQVRDFETVSFGSFWTGFD
jgi:hypothetical protein